MKPTHRLFDRDTQVYQNQAMSLRSVLFNSTMVVLGKGAHRGNIIAFAYRLSDQLFSINTLAAVV